MTAESQSLRDALVATTASYRHAHEEHRRAGPEGRARRHLEDRLEELSVDFERLLTAAAIDDVVREQWRCHLYHGAAEPELPATEPVPPPAHRRPARERGRGSAPLWQR